jgi:excisionase family DNA binding protein
MVKIMTVKEVAAFLKLKEATICSLASEGKLPGFKLGKSWRFDMNEIENWIAEMPRTVMGKTDGSSKNSGKEDC